MKKLNYLAGLFLVLAMSGCKEQKPEVNETDWYEVQTVNKPFTRWWWLGSAVDKENLTYNLELYSKAGIGGVEIEPIYGVQGNEANDIEYLSPKWMEMYKHTVSEANRLGMIVDLTNGTGWPFGGPEVSIEDAATRLIIQKFNISGGQELHNLIIASARSRRSDTETPIPNTTLSCLMAYATNGEILNITDKVGEDGKLDWTAPEGPDWTLYAIFNGKTMQEVKRAAPGGEGLVFDHMSISALKKYLKRFDDAFAEHNAPAPRAYFNDSYEVYGGDWTPNFLAEFAKRRGYKLEEYLPEYEALGATDESRRIISDYRQTIAEVLTDNFIRPWEEWAHKQGALIRNQSHGSPGNLIDIYASVDIPECETFGRTDFDIPGLRKDPGMKSNDSNPMVLKFASSGANITGKTLTSAETFTWLTEHHRTSLSQCKPELDQMFASGVNHVFFHGTPYSPKEAEWPGWRFYASINMAPTDPMWRDADQFFAYIARCQSFLQHGNSDNDFLLYFPIYDFWNDYTKRQFMTFSIHGLVDMIPDFNKTVMDILAAGYNTDYISDDFIKTTKVKDGELVTSGGATYKALIVPQSRLMPKETLDKLLSLAKKGAKIIFTDRYPEDVPGFANLEKRRSSMQSVLAKLPAVSSFSSVETHSFGKGQIITGSNIADVLSKTDVKSESFANDFGGQFIRRKYDKGNIYFFSMLANNSIDGWVTIAADAKSAMIFDPMSGEKGRAQLRIENGNTQVYLQLKPDESVFVKTFENEEVDAAQWAYLTPENGKIDLTHGWSLSFEESYPAIEGVFAIDTLGSWTDLKIENATVNMGTAKYTVEFEIPANNAADWILDLGDVRESAEIVINGQNAGKLVSVPYTARVGKYLVPGKNTLEVYVTNLPANRIADYDRRGVEWRIFKNANIARQSSIELKDYPVSLSGLVTEVSLTPMRKTF